MTLASLNSEKLVPLLKEGVVGVLPTDTIYGISCSALNANAVERVMGLRGRDEKKPFIILIGELSHLALFDISLTRRLRARLTSIWPAPVSIILPCISSKFTYLHRGLQSLGVRMPKNTALLTLLKKTGPLITTSVNPQGHPPARTIEEAKEYFGDSLDFYVDGGRLEGEPSTLARLEEGHFVVLRQGSYILPAPTISGIN